MALDEHDVTLALLKPNAATAAEVSDGVITLRMSAAWNRLNYTLVKGMPDNLRKAEATRRRIAKMR